MKEYQTIFLNLALDAKALEFGSFTLKSGRTSPYFFNAAKMLNGDLYKLAKCYQEAIDDSNISFDCIYGPAYKGIFLGSIVAMIFNQEGKNYPLSFNRKEIKDHGEGGNIIGSDPIGDVMIIDDVSCTPHRETNPIPWMMFVITCLAIILPSVYWSKATVTCTSQCRGWLSALVSPRLGPEVSGHSPGENSLL